MQARPCHSCSAVFLLTVSLILYLPLPALADDAILLTMPPIIAASSPSSPVPDTGVIQCQDADSSMICPAVGEAFYGQDAQYHPPCRQHSFTDNGDGTVTDKLTGLMWMQEDDGSNKTWLEASNYCDLLSPPDPMAAGHSDWRLPEVRELAYLVSLNHYNPSIDPIFSSRGSNYWTNTPAAWDSTKAWAVNFLYGYPYWFLLDSPTLFARCVRSAE